MKIPVSENVFLRTGTAVGAFGVAGALHVVVVVLRVAPVLAQRIRTRTDALLTLSDSVVLASNKIF